MKTIIKIHDTKWFKEHCKVSQPFNTLKPKYASWKPVQTISWLHEAITMGSLEGEVLEVEYDSGVCSGLITEARYKACGYWIPNWAIEWIKEEQDEIN